MGACKGELSRFVVVVVVVVLLLLFNDYDDGSGGDSDPGVHPDGKCAADVEEY